MTEDLRTCEVEVELARSRLERDLEILRSPATFENFKRTIADETVKAKDDILSSLSESAQSKLFDVVDDLKRRATVNPGATLVAGAGLAYYLARKPPITAALMGVGIYSLFRTRPARTSDLAQARDNLRTQVSEVAASVQDVGTRIGSEVAAKAGETMDAALQKASGLADVARDSLKKQGSRVGAMAQDTAARIRTDVADAFNAAMDAGMQKASAFAGEVVDQAETVQGAVRRTVHDTRDSVSKAGAASSVVARDAYENAGSYAHSNRDTLLLGLAGLAVSAAIGISVQRRLVG
jgi:hypothetical protein